MINEKKYFGFAKKIEFKNGGEMMKITLTEQNLNELLNLCKDGKVKLDIKSKKEVDKWGNTHSIELDTWQSTKKQDALPVQQSQPQKYQQQPTQERREVEYTDNGDEIPF